MAERIVLGIGGQGVDDRPDRPALFRRVSDIVDAIRAGNGDPVSIMGRVPAAGTAILAAALASCGSSLPAGPFAEPRTPSIQCTPLAGHKVMTFGDDFVQNHGKATAVIDKVTFVHPHHLRVLRIWAVPTTADLAGALSGPPPPADPPWQMVGWQWNHRHLAKGARVPPATGRYDRMNLVAVVSLTPGARRGTMAAMDIWYHVGVSRYRFRTSLGLVVVNRKSCPI